MAKSKKLSRSAADPTTATSVINGSSHRSTSNSSSTAQFPTWLHDGLPLPRLIVLDLDYTLWPFYSDIHISPPIRLVPNSHPPTLADRNGERFALYPDAPHILRLVSTHLPNTRLAVASKSPVGDLCREVLKLLRLPQSVSLPQPSRPPPPPQPSTTTAASAPDAPNGINNSSIATTTTTTTSTSTNPTSLSISNNNATSGPKRTIDAFDAGLEIYEGTKLRHFEVLAKRTGIPFSQMLFFDDERPNLEVESLGVTMRLVRDGLTWEELEKGIEQWRANQGVYG